MALLEMKLGFTLPQHCDDLNVLQQNKPIANGRPVCLNLMINRLTYVANPVEHYWSTGEDVVDYYFCIIYYS